MAERSTKVRGRKEISPAKIRRGEGSIYQTADGRYRGAIVVTDPTTGLKDRRVVSAQTFDLAEDRLNALRKDIANGVGAKGAARTLATYVEQTWLPGLRLRVRPSTGRAHEQHLRDHLLPSLGALRLREITPSAVERVMGTMVRQGKSASTARAVRTTLGQVLHDAQRDGLINRNVASLARPPRMERHEMKILTAEQTRVVLDGTADDPFGPLFAIAATTGLRQGELLGLAWPDLALDAARPTLTVRRSLARGEAGSAPMLAEPKTPARAGRSNSARPRRGLFTGRRPARRPINSQRPETSGRTWSRWSSGPRRPAPRSVGRHEGIRGGPEAARSAACPVPRPPARCRELAPESGGPASPRLRAARTQLHRHHG